MKHIIHSCVMGIVLAANSAAALDVVSFSNTLEQIAAEKAERGQQVVEACKLLVINQAIGRELGRTVEETQDAEVLRKAHQELAAAYVADIRRRIAAPETTWPADRKADVWKKAATGTLDQAVEVHGKAFAAGADLTSSLRLMAQVWAWTNGKETLAAGEDWTASVESRVEGLTLGKVDFRDKTKPAPDPSLAPPPALDPPAKPESPALGPPTKPETPALAPPAKPETLPLDPPGNPEPPVAVPRVTEPPSQEPPAQPAPPVVTLVVEDYRDQNKVAVRHNLSVFDKSAWIGFYKIEAGNRKYLSYTFLNNLTDRLYDVPRPEEPGTYQFRIFTDKGYSPAAVSAPIEVK